MSPMRRQILDMAIFVGIHFLLSLPQRIVDVIDGSTNQVHTRKVICTPENAGSISMRKARVITIKNVEINSASIIFHMPSIAFFISSFENSRSP